MPAKVILDHVELVDRIYDRVKQMIFDQELAPGEKLIQEKLASSLGVSRSPLLKALQRLESEFLVEKKPRRGIYVKSLSLSEIIDVFQVRSVIEGLSARLAAKHIQTEDIKCLRNMFLPFQKKKKIDPREYAIADRNFHHKIMMIGGNALILKLELLSHMHLKAFQAGLLRSPEQTLEEHLAIIDALEQRQEKEAEKLMRQHIERSLKNLISQKNPE